MGFFKAFKDLYNEDERTQQEIQYAKEKHNKRLLKIKFLGEVFISEGFYAEATGVLLSCGATVSTVRLDTPKGYVDITEYNYRIQEKS